MPISFAWADEHHTTVQYTFDGAWTWDDWYAVYAAGMALETSVDHRVDIILDLRQSGRMPANILAHLKKIITMRPSGQGVYVVVTPAPTIKTLFNIGCRFDSQFKQLYRLVDTPNQARRLIAESRLDAMKTPTPLR